MGEKNRRIGADEDGGPFLTIQCHCGALRGELRDPPWLNRAICYCNACQGFPERLGHAESVLDSQGGSDILQTAPGSVHFTEGKEHLACLRMTDKGPLRWYAACCNAPLGNTPGSPRLSFIGLIHSALGGHESLDAAYGPVEVFVYTETARGEPKPEKRLPKSLVLSFGWNMLRARLSGSWKNNPFFGEDGRPVVKPEPPLKA